MKITVSIIGGLAMLAGGVWFFQGIGVLPGSYMTGQTRWALYGGLAFVVGCGLLIVALTRKKAKAAQ